MLTLAFGKYRGRSLDDVPACGGDPSVMAAIDFAARRLRELVVGAE
jgi:hypothetical protein